MTAMVEARIRTNIPELQQIAERNGHVLEPWRLLGDFAPPRSPVHGPATIGPGYEGGITCNACGARAIVSTGRPRVESALLRPCKVYVLFKEDVRAAQRPRVR